MEFVAESQRLGLQPLSIEEHLEGYLALNADLRVTRWSYRLPSKTPAEAQAVMLTRLRSEKEPWMENYAILLQPIPGEEAKKPIMIGCIGIPRLSQDFQGAEVGYGLNPEFWGLGYATEALRLFIQYYFSSQREIQKEFLLAYTEPENTSSAKVLAKVGFLKGELFGGVEVTDPQSGVKLLKDFHSWRFDKPKLDM